MKKNWSFEEAKRNVDRSVEILNKKYNGSRSPVKCRCKICRHIWTTFWATLFQSHKCPKCAARHTSKIRSLTLTQARRKARKRSPNIIILKKVQYSRDRTTRLKCRCRRCKHVWIVSWDGILHGNGCPLCHPRHRFTFAEAVRKTKEANSKVRVLETKYPNSKSRVRVLCKQCKHTWTSLWNRLFSGKGCPNCASNHKPTLAEAKKRIRKVSPSILVLEKKYLSSFTKAKCRCRKCGHRWKVLWNNLAHGIGCPNCALKRNKSENYVRDILEKLTGYKFPPSKPRWLHGMRLDGFNKRHNIAFEYQGEQHYRIFQHLGGEKTLDAVKRNDNRKRVLCYQHGVHLIRIPHWKKKNVKQFIEGKLRGIL